MDHYYLNDQAQPTGEHEVHKEGCAYFPNDRTYLGYFSSCRDAVTKARAVYPNVDGCYSCSRECHSR